MTAIHHPGSERAGHPTTRDELTGAAEQQTVVNWVIEHRLPGRPWLTLWSAPETGEVDRGYADAVFAGMTGGTVLDQFPRMRYRLVRRTALITDEVLAAAGPAQEQGGETGE